MRDDANRDMTSRQEESIAAMKTAIEAMQLGDMEKSAAEYFFGLHDVLGVLVAKLVGRGVLEAADLRLDLLGCAAVSRNCGAEFRAAPVELLAENIKLMIKEMADAGKYPTVSGRA